MNISDFSRDELRELSNAIQWGAFFAPSDCLPNGPTLSTLRAATDALESRGLPVYHSRTTRARLNGEALS